MNHNTHKLLKVKEHCPLKMLFLWITSLQGDERWFFEPLVGKYTISYTKGNISVCKCALKKFQDAT